MIRKRVSAAGEVSWQWRVTRTRGGVRLAAEYGTCPTAKCARECSREAEGRMHGRAATGPFAEVLEAYRTNYLPQIPDSRALYERHLAFWVDELGAIDRAAITPQLVARCRDRLITGGRKLERSPATVNRYLQTLSSVFSWAAAAERGLVTGNPVRDVERLKEPKGRVRFLSRPGDAGEAAGDASELERLLKACRESTSSVLYDLVCVMLTTGCRETEVLSLPRRAVRLAEGGFTLAASDTKTEEARFVPLAGLGLEAVKRRLELPARGSRFLFPGQRRANHAAFPWTAWRTAIRRAGIDDFRPHDLRHTYGSYLVMLGESIPAVQQQLGHKTVASTMRYVHLADSTKTRTSRVANVAISRWAEGKPARVAHSKVSPNENQR